MAWGFVVCGVGARGTRRGTASGCEPTVRAMPSGSIERLPSGRHRVVVSAGKDPVTGKRLKLTETCDTQDGARVALARLREAVEADAHPQRSATVAMLLEQWLEVVDHALSTRETTEGYVRRTIVPAIGDMPLRKLQHRVDLLDRLYTHLRRCNKLCDGRGVAVHAAEGAHDCAVVGCERHECRPMSPGSVRRVHAILSAALGYAVAWGWIEKNPAEYAHPPKLSRRRARPPEPAQVARLLNLAWRTDVELAVFLWLATTTGARRGELTALRWTAVDFGAAVLRIESAYAVRAGRRELKATKTDTDRRLALDALTVQLLRDFWEQRAAALAPGKLRLAAEAFVFGPDPMGSRPWHPDHFTHAYRHLADVLDIAEPLKNLRHFNATQLLAAGVDLRTTAGRLGHSDGGATTLRVYADWLPATDRAAAEQLATDLAALRAAEAASEATERLGVGRVLDDALDAAAGAGGPVQGGSSGGKRRAGGVLSREGHQGREGPAGGALPRVERRLADLVEPPVDGRTTYRDVAGALAEAIEAGRLKPGDLVPSVGELSMWFGIARSTASRAFGQLADDGYVMRRGHRYVVVYGRAETDGSSAVRLDDVEAS